MSNTATAIGTSKLLAYCSPAIARTVKIPASSGTTIRESSGNARGWRAAPPAAAPGKAARAHALVAHTVADLEQAAAILTTPCGFNGTASVCLASRRRHSRELEQEAGLRQRYGLDAGYWSPARVRDTYGFPSHGALHTNCAGVLDPVRFTRALLSRAMSHGGVLLTRTP